MSMGFRNVVSLLARVVLLIAILGGSFALPGPERAAGAVECEIPDPIPEATPLTGDGDAASPVDAGNAATPVDAEDPQPPTRRELLQAGLERLVQTFAACRSAGDYATMSRLVTEKYLGAVFGGGPRLSRPAFLELAVALPLVSVRFRDFDDLSLPDDGEARANVKWIVGNQLVFERLTFVEEERRPGSWLIDTTSPLRVRPPRDHAEIEVSISGNRYDPAALTADQSTVEINVENGDEEDHELLVLALPAGRTPSQLLLQPGPSLPSGVTYIGQVTIPGQAKGNIVLVNLKPGTYQIVDLLPSENGVPHLSLGMAGTLTITE
jgi:hypothetical protein